MTPDELAAQPSDELRAIANRICMENQWLHEKISESQLAGVLHKYLQPLLSQAAEAERLREACRAALPNMIELSRFYKAHQGREWTQDFDMTIEKLQAALAPAGKATNLGDDEEYKKYCADHEVCPQCGTNNYEHTTAGIMWIDGRFNDRNRVSCHCGWRGVGDDLKPREKTALD